MNRDNELVERDLGSLLFDNFAGPGTYRIYWRYQKQCDYYDKYFNTKEEANAQITRDEKRGYIVRKVCKLI